YRLFYVRLLSLYRLAKRYQKDQRLSVGRAAKVEELQKKVLQLCKRYMEEIVTESQAEKNGWDKSCVTSEPEAKMIRLQKELVEKLDCLFVFVEHPEVESTNNQSERDLRREALARKTCRTSRSQRGAERRGIIISVLGTMKRRLKEFSLKNSVDYVKESYQKGVSIFEILKPPDLKSPHSQ
ncbi:MAG: transposase, partial [Planctomycetaceae bacterium]|nr:transposase [Planctomycetaceae bacterium]